ncbi:hypothetical protein KY366_00980 [Candidatus Woesearchaeota archaeon]|nr:hypothetical protein [Candidatus Woesearchaeota archaeon]
MKLNRLSLKRWIVIILVVLIVLASVLPLEMLAGKVSILGAAVAKVFIKSLDMNTTCNLTMVEGWNLVTFACIPSDKTPGSMLDPIYGDYASIHNYDASDDSDHWKAYNPSLPSWVVQDITLISEKKGYWVNVENDCNLSIRGTIKYPNMINVVRGWNLIGYPLNASKSPSDAFSYINGSYSIVWTYNTTEDAYLYYNPYLGSGTLTEITPVKGYWINMTEDDTLWVI